MSTDNSYNQFEQLPLLTYKIIAYLMQNNENLWKLLNFPNTNALDQPNLTMSQKASLIYNGQEDSTPYRIFQNAFPLDDALDVRCAFIRVFPYIISPENRTLGGINMMFEFIAHTKIEQLNNYQTRTLTMMQETLKTLNGVDVGGIGNIFFNKNTNTSVGRNNIARYNIYNNRNYGGMSLVMGIYGV